MRYQALALDLDGTLTNSKKEVTPATRAALGRAMFEGCKVILASGRPLVGIQPVAWALGLPRLGGYILAYNGGQVVDCRTGRPCGRTGWTRHRFAVCVNLPVSRA